MPTFSGELLALARKVRIERDRFDLLISDGDTPTDQIRECEKKIDIATLAMVEFLRINDR